MTVKLIATAVVVYEIDEGHYTDAVSKNDMASIDEENLVNGAMEFGDLIEMSDDVTFKVEVLDE